MKKHFLQAGGHVLRFLGCLLQLAIPFFLIETFVFLILKPENLHVLSFGGLWAFLLAGLILLLPRKISRICYGIVYFPIALWAIAQAGYYQVFDKMMWLSTMSYAGEGLSYLGDVISSFNALWWIGGILLLGLGVLNIWQYPKSHEKLYQRLPYVLVAAFCILQLCLLPEIVFLRDDDVWGTHSEYGQSSSYRAAYNTMFDAQRTYEVCGIFQTTMRDIYKHNLYPLTPAYLKAQAEELTQIDDYFAQRDTIGENEMTGLLAGKNVVLVLMESMDDWMITPEDTPTLYKLMGEGINFTNFYTPGYGNARTLNSEFCMNTGIYLPTTGHYVFDYVTNSWNQSFASQFTANGYTAEVFHYNNPEFYSRGVFEPAMGYNTYNSYEYYETDENALYDDCLLFEIPQLQELFFREGPTFNTIITRSAHLSYVYNEVLSYYALKQYPDYRGKYGSQEEDCARVKAKLVDDMFARLLEELEAAGQLENTVIIGMTDHYTYGYKNMDELYAHSGVDAELLLEKTPCFIWSADGPTLQVDKTLSTADLLPTALNLLGIDSPYQYLGQDAFDPAYAGYAFFPDGSWATDGIVCLVDDGEVEILQNEKNLPVTQEMIQFMAQASSDYIRISNLLLTSDYYKEIRTAK